MEEAREFEAPIFEPDALDAKVQDSFDGMAVRKDLTAKMKRGANVPISLVTPTINKQARVPCSGLFR